MGPLGDHVVQKFSAAGAAALNTGVAYATCLLLPLLVLRLASLAAIDPTSRGCNSITGPRSDPLFILGAGSAPCGQTPAVTPAMVVAVNMKKTCGQLSEIRWCSLLMGTTGSANRYYVSP